MDEHVLPKSAARPCTHAAVIAPPGGGDEGGATHEPPPAAHASLQFWPTAASCHSFPVFPQSASADGGTGGDVEEGGGGGGDGGGAEWKNSKLLGDVTDPYR